MKTNNTIFRFKNLGLALSLFATLGLVTSCKDDDDHVPEIENEEEIITDFNLVFTNVDDANDVIEARAQDPDGDGIEEIQVLDEIALDANKTYELTFEILNTLAEEEDEDHDDHDDHGHSHGEDIGEEIEEEAEDHQFFFEFTNDAFANPSGKGNITDDSGMVNYNDKDANGNPIGLSTNWTAGGTALSDGSFRVRLQHQPDIKSSTSGASDGDTDIDITFVLNIQ